MVAMAAEQIQARRQRTVCLLVEEDLLDLIRLMLQMVAQVAQTQQEPVGQLLILLNHLQCHLG
jgi:hypothetical protein